MQVSFKNDASTVKLAEVEAGDLFVYEGRLFAKQPGGVGDVNAMRIGKLGDCEPRFNKFALDKVVERVAEITLRMDRVQ